MANKRQASMSKTVKRWRGVAKPNVPRSLPKFGSFPRGNGFTTGPPQMLKMSHKYVYDSVLTWTAAGAGFNTVYDSFSCNGLYDPEVAAGGHQPLYFDQMAQLYNHYVVTGCKIEVEFGGQDTDPMVVGIALDDDGSLTYPNLGALCEQPGTVSRCIANADVVKLTRYWSLAKTFGAGSSTASQFRGSATANPTETQAFAVFARAVDVAATASSCTIHVTLTYFTEWKELKDIAGS